MDGTDAGGRAFHPFVEPLEEPPVCHRKAKRVITGNLRYRPVTQKQTCQYLSSPRPEFGVRTAPVVPVHRKAGEDLAGFRAVETPRAAVEFVESRVGEGG